MTALATTDGPKTWWRRFAFLLAASYLVLFNLPFPLGFYFYETWANRVYTKLWQVIVPWVGHHVLRFSNAYSDPSFILDDSDSMFEWIRVLCFLVVAFAGALVWGWFDVRRRHDRMVHDLVRVYLRYVLAATMLMYGVIKVMHLQMPYPSPDVLLATYGDSDPGGLMWTFMGYSPAYQAFTGLAEVAGALLLLFRRTTTLGALVVAAVMSNIVMLDLCYDVPVKLDAMHLLLFALFLLGPDLLRLANVLVLNRPAEAAPLARNWPTRWIGNAAGVTKVLMVGWILYLSVGQELWRAASIYHTPKPELYGIYDVEVFTRDGQTVPPLLTDKTRWRRVNFGEEGGLEVFRMDHSYFFGYRPEKITHLRTDSTQGVLTLNSGSGQAGTLPILVAYTRPAPDQLRLNGRFDGAELSMLLRRIDEKNFPLVKHKFRWVGR